MAGANSRQWVKTHEAAELLGVGVTTVRRMIEQGALPGAWRWRTGKKWFVPREAIDAFIASTRPIARSVQVATAAAVNAALAMVRADGEETE